MGSNRAKGTFAAAVSATAVVLLLGARPVSAWETVVGPGRGEAIAVDGSGRVFSGGGSTLVALDAATGVELWRYVIGDGGSDGELLHTLALDSTDDVIALRRQSGFDSVVKVDGATGSEIWRRDFASPYYASDMAVDGGDDVVVAMVDSGGFGNTGALVKLDAATGADVWNEASACPFGPIAIDGGGDVFSFGTGVAPFCKSDAATGVEVWAEPFAAPGSPTDIALDSLGDVVVVGEGFDVAKLSGATGALQWQQTLGSSLLSHRANRVAIDAADDVVVGGFIDSGLVPPSLIKLDGTSGVEIWRRNVHAEVSDLALTSSGNVLAARSPSLSSNDGARDLILFRGSDGEALWVSYGGDPLALDSNDYAFSIPFDAEDWRVVRTGGPLTGRLLRVLDTPGGTKLVLKVKDRTILLPQVELDPTTVGAVLELRNPSTGETDTISLPAVHWTTTIAISPTYEATLKYVDRDGIDGPCRKAKVTRSVLTVKCKGIAFTLDEPTQGSLRTTLVFGGDPVSRQCAEFGGTTQIDGPGAFKATDAPSPPICP